MLQQAVLDSNLLTYLKAGCCDFWTINPYALCEFNCSYCITKAQGVSVPSFSKRESVALIEQAVDDIPADLTFAIGGITDPYPYVEETYGVTRAILELLRCRKRAFAVITKGTLVERDVDLIEGNPNAMVVLSFSTLDDSLAAQFELNAPLPSRRWRTLEKLHVLGIRTEISLSPWIPGVTNIDQILKQVPAGVRVRVERLKIVRSSRKFSISGKVLSQADIDQLYLRERERYAGFEQLTWEMDVRFSQFSAGESHPCDLAMRQHYYALSQLENTGRLQTAANNAVIVSSR